MKTTDRNTITEEQGFSLVELLVVLSLVGLITTFVMTAYFYAEQAITNWKHATRLENELHTLAEGLADDIYKAEAVMEVGEGFISLEVFGHEQRQYELDQGKLFRNGVNITSEDISIISFYTENGMQTEKDSVDPKLLEIRLALGNGEDTLSTRRAVSIRKPITWKQLRGD